MHSDTPFHRHHWEMDFADVNTGGIRGFVDVVAAAVSFVACVFEAQPPFLRPRKHVSDTTCASLYSTTGRGEWWSLQDKSGVTAAAAAAKVVLVTEQKCFMKEKY